MAAGHTANCGYSSDFYLSVYDSQPSAWDHELPSSCISQTTPLSWSEAWYHPNGSEAQQPESAASTRFDASSRTLYRGVADRNVQPVSASYTSRQRQERKSTDNGEFDSHYCGVHLPITIKSPSSNGERHALMPDWGFLYGYRSSSPASNTIFPYRE